MPIWPWSKRKGAAVTADQRSAAPGATVERPAAASVATAEPGPTQPDAIVEQRPVQQEEELPMAINTMDYSAKNLILDVVRTERGRFYQFIDDPRNWEAPTRSGHWQVRDLAGHMIDVTEGYLTRWDVARRSEDAPNALGLLVMASELDRVATTFRNLPREEVIARLKSSSDKLLNIFHELTADQWGGFNVAHIFMGPLPTFFFPAFQIMDYGVHTWDIRATLVDPNAKLDERTAGVLVPYMFILMQSTVDQNSARDVDINYGVRVGGEWGGAWNVRVKDGQLAYTPAEAGAAPAATIHFNDASDFVLTTFGRIKAGTASGDPTVGEKAQNLFFRI